MAKLRKDNYELLAFKRSIDLYFSSTAPLRDPRRLAQPASYSESISTFHDFSPSPSHKNNADPAPSFLKAALLLNNDNFESDNHKELGHP